MIKEFKKFIIRGNLVDLAIGFSVGAAFSTVARSLVTDIIMPPIGALTGTKDFTNQFIVLRNGTTPPPYQTISEAESIGAITLNYGRFLNSVLALILVAIAMFIIIRFVNKLDEQVVQSRGKQKELKENQPTDKKCPYCFSTIDYRATKCSACTSKLPKNEP